MKKLTHKDFRLALKKWNWIRKKWHYTLNNDYNYKRMIEDIPELEDYKDSSYCSFYAKYYVLTDDCPDCPFPDNEKCVKDGSIFDRWLSKTNKGEDAITEAKEMVELNRRLYKKWKNEKRI